MNKTGLMSGNHFPGKSSTPKVTMGDYSNLTKPLPPLPTGHEWVRNPETREWSVIDTATKGPITNETISVNLNDRKLPDNCDYVTHQVQSADTFQGICLKYGITPTSLRQTNKFSGSNLLFAPELLIIPLVRKVNAKLELNNKLWKSNVATSKQQKLNEFIMAFRKHRAAELITGKEAQAYLDMNDGNLEMAIRDAKADFGWEVGEGNENTYLLE